MTTVFSADDLHKCIAGTKLPKKYVHPLTDFFAQVCVAPEIYSCFIKSRTAVLAGSLTEEAVENPFDTIPNKRMFLLLLAVSCYTESYNAYQKNGVDTERQADTMDDFTIWTEYHEQNFGFPGLQWDMFIWLCKGIFCDHVRFGRLQCDLKKTFEHEGTFYRQEPSELVWVKNGAPPIGKAALLTTGDPVVNIHIPASGPLTLSECIESFRLMTEFFNQKQSYWPYKAFVCYSWLCDPQLQELLASESNCVRFQRMGHIYFSTENHAETVWRVFGEKARREGINAVAHSTSLQRCLAKFANAGGRFKSALWLLFRDEWEKLSVCTSSR